MNEIEEGEPSSGQDEVLVEADALESDSDSLDDDIYREYDHFSTSDSEDENKYGHVSQELPALLSTSMAGAGNFGAA